MACSRAYCPWSCRKLNCRDHTFHTPPHIMRNCHLGLRITITDACWRVSLDRTMYRDGSRLFQHVSISASERAALEPAFLTPHLEDKQVEHERTYELLRSTCARAWTAREHNFMTRVILQPNWNWLQSESVCALHFFLYFSGSYRSDPPVFYKVSLPHDSHKKKGNSRDDCFSVRNWRRLEGTNHSQILHAWGNTRAKCTLLCMLLRTENPLV